MPLELANISIAASLEKHKLSSDAQWLVLVDITWPDGTHLRLCRNTDDVAYDAKDGFGPQTYTAFNFDFGQLEEKSDGSIPKWAVRCSNVNRAVEALLEEYSGGVGGSMAIYVVNTATWTRPGCVATNDVINASGSLGYTQSRSLGNNIAAVRWSGFKLAPGTTLPADAVIQGIYPVIIARATHDQAVSYYSYGNAGAAFTDTSEGNYFNQPSNPNSTSFSSTELYDLYPPGGGVVGIGTTLAALANWKIKVLLNTSLDIDVMADVAAATGVGFAVYYTSATPVTDPQMPPPFAVPGGQGLAWALPFTVEQSGVLAGGSGFFDPSTGYALGTPAYKLISAQEPEIALSFNILSSSSDAQWATFQLGAPSPFRFLHPRHVYTSNRCMWVYKSTECGYVGALPTCSLRIDGTNGCRGHGNQQRFGAFPGIDSNGIRIVSVR